MTRFFIIGAFVLLSSFAAVDLYTIQFPDSAGRIVNMNSFKGKRIIVAVINAKSPDVSYLKYLNQLQSKSDSIQVIAVPSTEFAGLFDPSKIDQLKTSSKISILLAKPSELKKSAKSNQHPLMAWLTDKEQNKHFDEDIDVTEKLYFINGSGVLYAILDIFATPETITKTLQQTIR